MKIREHVDLTIYFQVEHHTLSCGKISPTNLSLFEDKSYNYNSFFSLFFTVRSDCEL